MCACLLCCHVVGRELEQAVALVGLARFQQHAGPLWLVGRVGIVLRFEAYCGMFVVLLAVFACYASVEEVARVNLNARFVGVYIEFDACVVAVHACRDCLVVALSVLVG